MILAVSSSSARDYISSLLFIFNHCMVVECIFSFMLDYSLFRLYMLSSKSVAYNSIRIEHSLSHFSMVKLCSAIHLIVSLICSCADYSISVLFVYRNSITSSLRLFTSSLGDRV